MDITINVQGLGEVRATGRDRLALDLRGVEPIDLVAACEDHHGELLDAIGAPAAITHFKPKDVVSAVGTEELLDAIGQGECVAHFGLRLDRMA